LKIEHVTLEPVCYRLRKPILTHHGELRDRRGWRVRLLGPAGLIGLGEALPLPTSGGESPAESLAALEELASALDGRSGTLGELLDRVDETSPDAPSARCALDGALHHLAARAKGVALARLLGATPPVTVAVNALIGVGGTEESVESARAAQARGFRTLKLKLGGIQSDDEEVRLRAVRHAVGDSIRLRIDANGAWSAEEAIAFLTRVAALGIELVEQPVRADDLAGLARVHAEAPIAVAADETLTRPEGREALLDGKLATFAVLKPMLLGGLRSCVRFARAAAARGVHCIVTTTFEGWIGTAQATHLAAATHAGDRACGLASSDVLELDFPPELIPRNGVIHVRDHPGLGCSEPA